MSKSRIITTFLAASAVFMLAPASAHEHAKGGEPTHKMHEMRGAAHGHMGIESLLRGHGQMGRSSATPEQIERRVGHWMMELKGTPEQTKKISGIVAAAHADLGKLREVAHSLHERRKDALLSPVVNRSAYESTEKEMQKLYEQKRSRMNRAMLDIAEALTAEQRSLLKKRMQERHEMHQGMMGQHPRMMHTPGASAVR